MPKPKPADGQKRAKNIKEARRNVWLGLVFFTIALFMLCVEVRFWQSKPTTSLALDLLFTCALVLVGAFMRADAKETLRRGGEKYESFGSQLSMMLAMAGFFGGKLIEDGFPLFLLYGLVASLIGSILFTTWLAFRMRRIRRTKA